MSFWDLVTAIGQMPSWLDRANQQTQRDVSAYQQGGVPALMADTGEASDLAGGLGGTTKNVGIRAYHGSPYDFNKFDLSKIGTGEGAQAYGHGLYFAENPKVAQEYRDKLSSGSHARAIDEFLGNDTSAYPGRMYEVNINAHPDQFLNWYAPLSQQPQAVRDIASRVGQSRLKQGEPTGADLYNRVGVMAGPNTAFNESGLRQVLATNALNEAGIPGIKYLDQGSRGTGTGTNNYVVFNPDIVDIIKKYGLAGMLGGSALGLPQNPNNQVIGF